MDSLVSVLALSTVVLSGLIGFLGQRPHPALGGREAAAPWWSALCSDPENV